MKKKLVNRDLQKIVKVKLVKLLLGDLNTTVSSNRFYFQSDPQIDRSIVVGIVAHPSFSAPTPPGPISYGVDTVFASIYDIATTYEDLYYTTITTTVSSVTSAAYLSLVNPNNRFFVYQQPISSLTRANMGKYYKKFYSRIILDKCYLEFPGSVQFSLPGIPSTQYQLFSFYYIDDPNV